MVSGSAIFKENLRSLNVEFSDSAVVKMLREGSEQVFGQVFKTWFKPLHAYAFTILRDDAVAEEMVQNVFFNIWKKRERLEINGAVKSYLYRAVHNESLNYLKHQKRSEEHTSELQSLMRISYAVFCLKTKKDK